MYLTKLRFRVKEMIYDKPVCKLEGCTYMSVIIFFVPSPWSFAREED